MIRAFFVRSRKWKECRKWRKTAKYDIGTPRTGLGGKIDRSPYSFDDHVRITKVKYLPELWKWYRYDHECKRHGKITDKVCPNMLNIDDVTKLVDANSTELGQDGGFFYMKTLNAFNCGDALRLCATANAHKNYSNCLKQIVSSIQLRRYPEDYVASESGTMGD